MKHRGLRPASLVRYGPACRSIPQPCNGSARLGYSDRCPFTWQLEGPFSVAGWGRLLTSGLLSDPPRAAYSSSSKPFSYWGQVYAHSARPVNARPRDTACWWLGRTPGCALGNQGAKDFAQARVPELCLARWSTMNPLSPRGRTRVHCVSAAARREIALLGHWR